MDNLCSSLYLLPSIKKFVQSKNIHYYQHQIIHDSDVTPHTISIVMTSHERSRQTYFTLETICRSDVKDVQVIIVDDSTNDPLQPHILAQFGIHIELISIRRETKYWANPCVNYNIGFQYVRGGKVIIQNAEVCHVGDVLHYVDTHVKGSNYYVFDVHSSRDFITNSIIYEHNPLDVTIFNQNLWDTNTPWYQHYIHRNMNYHFLTALTKESIQKLQGFSYDYAFGSCFDDDDLLLKIQKEKLTIVNVKNDSSFVAGIHLYHGYTVNITQDDAYKKPSNEQLFLCKKRWLHYNGAYLELSDYEAYQSLLTKFEQLLKQ
jgi:hypothetical protein